MSLKKLQVLYDSAARTATPTAAEIDCRNGENVAVVVDVTATAATPSITVTFDFIDPISGTTVQLLSSTPITSTGMTIFQVGEDITASANVAAQHLLPEKLRVTVTHADADSITYSVTAFVRD